METAKQRDEYLHEPMDRRLWNESYYFDFTSDEVRGFLRLGFQPFERRANLWCYLVRDETVYWHRDERIRIEDCFGLHVDAGQFRQSFTVDVPHERWTIEASGQCSVSTDPWEVLTGSDERVPIELELAFSEPHHPAYSIEMLVETQDHYDQTGHYDGRLVLDGEELPIEGQGFRDHSWGWFRDWTPGKWGHFTGTLQFDTGDCLTLVAQIRPDGSVRNTFGYLADGETVTPVVDAGVACDDGLERDERGRAWAEGDLPATITYTPTFAEESAEISCEPIQNLPIGYEDCNWALSDPDGPWLTGVLNRMPVECQWGSATGAGWIEATHPFS